MRVIVTGASGFIGHNVLLRAPRDWQIVAVSCHDRGFEAFVSDHALTHVTPVRCDLSSEADILTLARAVGGRADAVLYLAANTEENNDVKALATDLQADIRKLSELVQEILALPLASSKSESRPHS